MDDAMRNELLEYIRRMQYGDGNPEEEYPVWLETIKRATGNPHAQGIISSREYHGMPAEEVLDRLMKYRPFLMPPPSS
jgi:hypothetical protein